jgi:hypothetical protein
MKMEEKKVVTEKSHLSGDGHEDLRVGREVMEAANTFGEVNPGRHAVIVERWMVHGQALLHFRGRRPACLSINPHEPNGILSAGLPGA